MNVLGCEIILKFIKGHSNHEETTKQIRDLLIETDEEEDEIQPPINTHIDFQNRLNSIIDELWNIAEEEKYLEFRKIVDDLRELFRTLCEKIDTTQQELNEVRKELDLMKSEIKNFNMSNGHLLLGSLSIQILIKIAKFLNHNESIFNAMSYSVSDINNMYNIHLLKSFLNNHGYDWDELKKTIKVLKFNKLSSAYPGDSNTTSNEIETAIHNCFPDTTYQFHIKAIEALNILRLLADESNESLFITIPY
jgi:hypothetical protein